MDNNCLLCRIYLQDKVFVGCCCILKMFYTTLGMKVVNLLTKQIELIKSQQFIKGSEAFITITIFNFDFYCYSLSLLIHFHKIRRKYRKISVNIGKHNRKKKTHVTILHEIFFFLFALSGWVGVTFLLLLCQHYCGPTFNNE